MKQAAFRLLAILIFVFGLNHSCFPIKAYYSTNVLSLNYGATNRLDKTYRNAYSIDYITISGGCVYVKFRGFGASFERTSISNYNVGMRYFYSPGRYAGFSGYYFYLGIAPTVFAISDNWGFNAAPEIGFYIPLSGNTFAASVNVFYGYDIPVTSESSYSNGRHRITLKIGFDIDTGELFGKEKKDF